MTATMAARTPEEQLTYARILLGLDAHTDIVGPLTSLVNRYDSLRFKVTTVSRQLKDIAKDLKAL